MPKAARLRYLLVAAMLLAAAPAGAQQLHHAGAVLSSPERLMSIPEADIQRDILPPAVDLSKYLPPVGDQGAQGSCVAWATGYAARGYYAYQVEHRSRGAAADIPSPAYIFDSIHDPSAGCDQGTQIMDAMLLLQRGAVSLATFPYVESSCAPPPASITAKATDFRISGFSRIDVGDLDAVKAALASGHPVVIAVMLNPDFDRMHGPLGASVWHAEEEKITKDSAFHAITVVAYDDQRRLFKFINSWSTEWGDNGYGRMDYSTFLARVYEGYIMRLPGDPDPVLTAGDYVADPEPGPEEVQKLPPSKGG